MIQEEKDLLLRDLCCRLPYGVIVDYRESEFETPRWKITTIYPETMDGRISYYKKIGVASESGSRPFEIGEVKPYLRPLSDMTEEEISEINSFYGDANSTQSDTDVATKIIDFYNERFFDFRGLIPMGLALPATKDMYKIKKK